MHNLWCLYRDKKREYRQSKEGGEREFMVLDYAYYVFVTCVLLNFLAVKWRGVDQIRHDFDTKVEVMDNKYGSLNINLIHLRRIQKCDAFDSRPKPRICTRG